MGVPRGRRTKSKQGHRRSHLGLKPPALTACVRCGSKIPPHSVCYNCGYYKGRQVVDVAVKADKKKKSSAK